MASAKIVPTNASDVTEATLKAGPARLLMFLQGAADPAVRAKFAALGWSTQRLEEAWGLLAMVKQASVLASAPVADPIAEAIAACEEWQAAGLIRARAMLQLSFPEQAFFIFHGFVAAKGTAAVLNVSTFLERRHVLENAAERKASRKTDREALAVLEEAGVTAEVLENLHGHVGTVQSATAAPRTEISDAEALRLDGLRKIHAWLTAWSDMARTVITRRDQLIRLGIAKRRPRKGSSVVVDPPVTVPTTPAPPPVAGPLAPPDGIVAAEADEPAPESRAA